MDSTPNLDVGLAYWEGTPATVDGVLGGFGTGALPRVDALGSRQFAQELLPYLVRVSCVLRPLEKSLSGPLRRIRALDIGAGIGRVTSTVLLHLVDDVVMVEPIPKFVETAKELAREGRWKGIDGNQSEKSVTFVTGPLQDYDPSLALSKQKANLDIERIGKAIEEDSDHEGFDVVWCQWTLGHLSDSDLIIFFKQAQKSLGTSPTNDPRESGIIVVKENVCRDQENDLPAVEFDPSDSSVTRSHLKWLEIFESSGLRLVTNKVQRGFPSGLYEVQMYALR